jgi:hypothetical protein
MDKAGINIVMSIATFTGIGRKPRARFSSHFPQLRWVTRATITPRWPKTVMAAAVDRAPAY